MTTEQGCFEIKERLFHKHPSKVEAAERRRAKDTLQQAAAAAWQPQNAGRPRKNEPAGPRPGSLRSVEKVTGGALSTSRSSMSRAAAKLAEHGGGWAAQQQDGRAADTRADGGRDQPDRLERELALRAGELSNGLCHVACCAAVLRAEARWAPSLDVATIAAAAARRSVSQYDLGNIGPVSPFGGLTHPRSSVIHHQSR